MEVLKQTVVVKGFCFGLCRLRLCEFSCWEDGVGVTALRPFLVTCCHSLA